MAGPTLKEWLEGRTPAPPPVFLPYLANDEGEGFRGTPQLESAGILGIRRALGQPGRQRPAAFDLLAGDAFLTYACEALAESEDPGGSLRELLQRLGAQLR